MKTPEGVHVFVGSFLFRKVAVGGWRHSLLAFEEAAEGGLVGEPETFGNFLYAEIGVSQKEPGVSHGGFIDPMKGTFSTVSFEE